MANDNKSPHILDGDNAKKLLHEDAFGLKEIAKALAEVVCSRLSKDGYIIGIEGKWGSGKTTLLNFVADILNQNQKSYHKIIRFEPWIIGDKKALLHVFFNELTIKLEELRAEHFTCMCDNIDNMIDDLIIHISMYAKYFDAAATLTSKAAVFDPTGKAYIFGWGLKAISRLMRLLKKPPPTLESLKEKIINDLRQLNCELPKARIVVLIDDTDRLEPSESVEILRLIKAVANFPLVTYLVCFDRTILAEQVHRAIQVENGDAYLEKIFQQIISVPPQEPFALRRWLQDRLTESFPEAMMSLNPENSEYVYRKEVILFDKWFGKFIETPRDARNLYEAVKFGWPYLEKKCDFLDYVWLQLIKLKCRQLYEWVKDYVTSLGSLRDGGRPGDEKPTTEAARLREIINGLGWSDRFHLIGMKYFLPGLGQFRPEDKQAKVFNFAPADETVAFEKGRRLGSPSHWRLYFAFDRPSYAVKDEAIDEFRQFLVTDLDNASKMLLNLAKKPHALAGYHLNVFLDRLKGQNFSAEEELTMAEAFTRTMDEIPRTKGAYFGQEDSWRTAIRLLGKAVGSKFADIIANGRSINWLALVMRDQGFAFGLSNQENADIDRQWMTRPDFDQASKKILQRFEDLGLDDICKMPEPLQIFLCWGQLGDRDKLRHTLEKAMNDNAMFIKILQAMRSWVNSSDKGFYQALHSQILKDFINVEIVKERLKTLHGDTMATTDLRDSAGDLLAAWNDT